MHIRFPVFLALAVMALTGAVSAQQTAPTSSTETYGDWTRRCSAVPVTEDQTEWRCEMAQAVQLRETGQTLLEAGLGRVEAGEPISLVFQVPNTVWLRTPIGMFFGEDPEAEMAASASYFRCSAQVCLADLQFSDELLEGLMSETTLTVSVEDGNRRTIRIPLSLNGFADAFEATFPEEAETADATEGGE